MCLAPGKVSASNEQEHRESEARSTKSGCYLEFSKQDTAVWNMRNEMLLDGIREESVNSEPGLMINL